MQPFWGLIFVFTLCAAGGIWYVFKKAKDKAGGPPNAAV